MSLMKRKLLKEALVKSYREMRATFGHLSTDFPPATNEYDDEPSPPPPEVTELKEAFIKTLSENARPGPSQFKQLFIEVTIIEDPFFFKRIAMILVEDKKGEVGVLAMSGFQNNETFWGKFTYGTVIRIVQPCLMGVGHVFHGLIHHCHLFGLADPRTITTIGKKKDMCRYCGKENATKECLMCKRLHCDQNCDFCDWKHQDHWRICKTPLSILQGENEL